MVSHDGDQHKQGQVWSHGDAPSTSVVSEEIRFEWEVNGPFVEKMCPSEVSNHEKLIDTHLSARWELSNDADGVSNGATVWSQRAKEKTGFSSNRTFSLQNHSFACVAVLNVERREGPKSCSDHSGQTDRWNRDSLVAGKRPNPTLCFWYIKSLD